MLLFFLACDCYKFKLAPLKPFTGLYRWFTLVNEHIGSNPSTCMHWRILFSCWSCDQHRFLWTGRGPCWHLQQRFITYRIALTFSRYVICHIWGEPTCSFKWEILPKLRRNTDHHDWRLQFLQYSTVFGGVGLGSKPLIFVYLAAQAMLRMCRNKAWQLSEPM